MVGIFFTARLGSTRLPQKHLIEVSGKSFIEWLVKRYLYEFRNEINAGEVGLFITTSIELTNKEFEKVFSDLNVSVFYGSDSNIPLRHLECAEANHIEEIVSIDGDDILCSPSAARIVAEKLRTTSDMVQTKGLPLGMNVMGYRRDFLKRSLQQSTQVKLETGWGKIFNQDCIEEIRIDGFENAGDLRMTLDYNDDALFFKTVIENIGDEILKISDNALVSQIFENGWQQLNIGLNNEYWENFNKQKQKEN